MHFGEEPRSTEQDSHLSKLIQTKEKNNIATCLQCTFIQVLYKKDCFRIRLKDVLY